MCLQYRDINKASKQYRYINKWIFQGYEIVFQLEGGQWLHYNGHIDLQWAYRDKTYTSER